ncbi:MAG: hypothetical protein L0Z62_16370 [Gemmataceae bacterium]|nr:hypothetical protein [Gemmataceae bacterium]
MKWALLGAALGSLCACPDGLLLGLIVAGTPGGAMRWAGMFALGGAVLGGLVGLLGALLGGRMVLRPPEE